MQTRLSRLSHSVLPAICLFFAIGNAAAEESDPDGRLFASSPDPVSDVQQALERADGADRRVLVVLGANWCHDSRALAARLNKSPLSGVIEEDYELVFVDVGFLNKGGDVLEELGVAQFYATPTVLVLDPSSGQVINNEDRHIWGAADSISMSSSVDYFETWASKDSAAETATDSEQLRRLNAQIDQFEQQMAARVADGYAVVGPMLEDFKAGGTPQKFRSSWDELRDFRTAIPGDVQALRDEAKQRVSAGEEGVELEFPEYAPLSWETE